MSDVSGKLVFITGASAGIGLGVARAFARERCRLLLLARRGERLSELAAQLRDLHHCESRCVTVDLRDRRLLLELLDALPQEWRSVDILVNNAGLSRALDPIQTGDAADWDEMLDVNVRALLWVTQWVLPGMLQRQAGHIINIGSIAGYETYPGGAVYSATKFAVRGLTRALKMDLHGTPLRVSSVDPGLVETEFSLVRFKGDRDRASRPYQGVLPLTPEDVGEAVVWTASRPAHVNVLSMTLVPTAQSSAQMVHRVSVSEVGADPKNPSKNP